MSNTIFLISGPSGSGKTSLTLALLQRIQSLKKIVTYTTRMPRNGEVDGLDYHFVSVDRFRELEHSGYFIETDSAYSELYGVPSRELVAGSDLAVIVTVEGARALRTMLSNSHSVFIVPGDTKAAAERVLRRAAPNALPRLRAYTDEVKSLYEYDTVIVNQDFDAAVEQFAATIQARRSA